MRPWRSIKCTGSSVGAMWRRKAGMAVQCGPRGCFADAGRGKAQRVVERCLRGLATLFSTQARQSTASVASVQTWTPCKRASPE